MIKCVPPTDDEFDRFVKPWKFDNTLGVLEVDQDDIEMGMYIGNGKKASTKKGVWKGLQVALKFVDPYDWRSEPYSQWELERYCDLKEVQGILVPKLHFVSRDKRTGKRIFGLELGAVVHYDDEDCEEQMERVKSKLIKTGWRQRDCSFRRDNVVWMRNADETKRIAAIDLESFLPSNHPEAPKPIRRHKEIFGLPVINPCELQIDHYYADIGWDSFCYSKSKSIYRGTWNGDKAVSIAFYRQALPFRACMNRLLEWREDKQEMVAQPIFLAVGRAGTIVVGYDGLLDEIVSRKDAQAFDASLCKLGWSASESNFDGFAYASQKDDEESKRVVVVDLSMLEPWEAATESESMSETSS